MSNDGQRPRYPRQAYEPAASGRAPSSYPRQGYAQPGLSRPVNASQQFVPPRYGFARERSDARMTDQPSAAFSRANRDRGLSNVFGSNADSFRRPPSNMPLRMPQSSAGYQEIPVSQEMSMSDGPTDTLGPERLSGSYFGSQLGSSQLGGERAQNALFGSRGPAPGLRQPSLHGTQSTHQHIGVGGADPALQVRFRRIADALVEADVVFPMRSSQLTAEHAIQAFAHFYGMFLPMPPDFPHLDFTAPEDHEAARLKSGINAVNGLLEDLCYDDRRQTVAELANLSLIEHPYHTVSALFWLMDLAEHARLAVPQSDKDDVPRMADSQEYAEYAVRMLYASSLSNSPDATVPEAHAYIDGALAHFRLEKEESVKRYKAEIEALKKDQVEASRIIESEAARLAELETRRDQSEVRKQALLSDLESLRTTHLSLETEANKKAAELSQARDNLNSMVAKLTDIGIESPQRALELANKLRTQQIQLEALENELLQTQSAVLSEKSQPVHQQLDGLRAMVHNYNESVSSDIALPELPGNVDELLGKSASDLLPAQAKLTISEQWQVSAQQEEAEVLSLQSVLADTETKIRDLESSVRLRHQENAQLTAALERASTTLADKRRDVHQLESQLQSREQQLQNYEPEDEIRATEEQLRQAQDQVVALETSNKELELKMRQCADRKREIRVLLETYKAAYTRIVEGIAQRESAIRQQEKAVGNLERVLLDFTPPNISARKRPAPYT